MSDKERFEERYKTGKTPWELKRPDRHLINVIKKYNILPGRALEIGCGTGSNAIWLAQNRFEVTGIDFSTLAVEKARLNARSQGENLQFSASDFLDRTVMNGKFEFIFDRGCFHGFSKKKEINIFVANAARHLKKGGLWFSIMGNADDKPRDEGPPMRSALDIVTAVEPYFEILSLVADRFDSSREKSARCWLCLMKRR